MNPLSAPDIPVPAAVLSRTGGAPGWRLTDANAAFLRFWGLERAEAVDREPAPVWSSALSTAAAQAVLAEGRAYVWCATCPRGARAPADVEITAAPLLASDGRQVLVTCTDITDRLRSERSLRISEQRLRNLAANIPGVIFRYVLHPDGTDAVAYMSPGCADLWEISAEEAERDITSLWAIVDREDYGPLRESVLQSARTLRPWLHEWRVTTASGQRKWMQGRGRPSARENGDVVWDSLVLDITAAKAAEAARAELEHQLLQAQRLESLGRLAGGVAHDFNNLLTVILANAEEAAADAAPGSALAERLGEVKAAALRSAELVRQLLAFARRQVVTPQVVVLDDEIDQMLGLLRRLVGDCNELIWSPAASGCNIEIDPGQLSQVIANLVVNARDAVAGAATGRITIATRQQAIADGEVSGCPAGSYVRLSVTDDGRGMDEATRARVFEPFFTTKTGGRGTGLGLSTVHSIVLQNRGGIEVQSEPGGGAAFHVYLPLCSAYRSPDPGPKPAASAAAPIASGRTVLLVEDEAALLAVGQRMLQQLGCRVLATTSAHEALAIMEREPGVDLLLTDMVMPEMSGQALAERARAMRPGLPVLFLSANFDLSTAAQGAPGGGAHLLSKPFTAADLEARVRIALTRRPGG